MFCLGVWGVSFRVFRVFRVFCLGLRGGGVVKGESRRWWLRRVERVV